MNHFRRIVCVLLFASALALAASRLVDINHASRAELMSLPGVEAARAEEIIRGRPYANKAQLQSRGILGAAAYKRVRSLIVARQRQSEHGPALIR
jgi:DNA uptake protein ComE-like DNA-binding protein